MAEKSAISEWRRSRNTSSGSPRTSNLAMRLREEAKNMLPRTVYVLYRVGVPSAAAEWLTPSSQVTSSRRPVFQLVAMADTATPASTATAKSVRTARTVTRMMTRASTRDTLRKTRNVFQLKVEITMAKSTPVSTATGISFTSEDATTVMRMMTMAATAADRRPRAPLRTLMVDCPIMVSPPMPPSSAERKLPVPCAMHSMVTARSVGTVLVSSLTAWRVMTDSMRPMAAKMKP
mmetsp:Transcript_3344/g.10496  ORF Transcript_3344/g.10496 Transcript_3344/m.10496 type:complete len:234 (-) Transcript_3344:1016-1717(-)